MKVIWSAASVRRLREIVEYIEPESSSGASTTRRRILKTALRVGQMPYSGRIGRVEGTREAVVPGSPYILVYQVSAQAVEIVGVWHAARLWPESF
jgi:plasmid stabilization system protein ParE